MMMMISFRIPGVQLHTTGALMAASVEDFNQAKVQLGTLKNDPGNEVKLKIYALFKQVKINRLFCHFAKRSICLTNDKPKCSCSHAPIYSPFSISSGSLI